MLRYSKITVWKAVNQKAHFPVVLVLYTGESCAFCQVAIHVFQNIPKNAKITVYFYQKKASVFWKAVNEKTHFPVVVLYTGESCAFCQVASHVFQTLKGLISSELVEFVSVDASANDLPWAFTALAVPSVLYFHPSSSTSSKPKAATHTTASSAATFSIWILLGIKSIVNFFSLCVKII